MSESIWNSLDIQKTLAFAFDYTTLEKYKFWGEAEILESSFGAKRSKVLAGIYKTHLLHS